MDPPKVFIDLALALGVGLLVGLQRERAGSAIAGIRTFPLIALAGAVAATLPEPANAWAVAVGLLAIGGLCFIGNWIRKPGDESPGVTTEAAMLLMFLVGALVVFGPRSAAVAVGAAAAVLLHAKPVLQQFTRRLGDGDLRAIMQFAVITLIILPIAPDQAYGPFGVLNPQRIWLMVVLIVGISLTAYVAHRLLGDRHGAILGGVLGGLISSTATTASFARQSRAVSASVPLACLAIVIASTILCVRLLVVLWVAAPQQWPTLATPVGILIAVGVVCVFLARLRSGGAATPLPPQENPTQLKSALIFAALFACVLLASAAARHYFGDRGTYVVAFLSGLTDMDAIALSTGGLVASGALDPLTGARAIIVAFIANTLFKTAMAGTLGGRRLLAYLAPFMVAQIATGAALLYWTPDAALASQGGRLAHQRGMPRAVTIASMNALPRFFPTPAAFRTWLQKNHKAASELIVGFYRVETGKPSITWPQSVAEALCFGWIDGVRRRHDTDSYTIRFTPRRPSSKWSAINIRLVAELEAAGRMTDAGRAAFEARPHKTGPKAAGYSYENREATLDAASVREFKKNKSAWKFFDAQPPGYRKVLAWWIMSAKQDATRARRLAKLIEHSAAGKRLQ